MTSRSPQFGQVSKKRHFAYGRPRRPLPRLDKLVQRRKRRGPRAVRRSRGRGRGWRGRRPSMCSAHIRAARMLVRAPLSSSLVCEIQPAMAARPTAEDVRRAVAEDGIEFLFAQFVDMHAKPSAKLVPAQQLDGLLADGAGLRRVRGRRHRPDARQPRPDRDARRRARSPSCRGSRRSAGSPATPRSRARRGPTARGRSCATRSSAPARPGIEFKIGCELEYFLVRQTEDGGIEVADPLDTLEQPCYDIRALTRSFDFVVRRDAARELARLADVRDRPRGRERAVRAELRLRRRAHDLRPRRLLPLHGRGAGPGARPDRDLHAEAVRPPDRQRRATST